MTLSLETLKTFVDFENPKFVQNQVLCRYCKNHHFKYAKMVYYSSRTSCCLKTFFFFKWKLNGMCVGLSLSVVRSKKVFRFAFVFLKNDWSQRTNHSFWTFVKWNDDTFLSWKKRFRKNNLFFYRDRPLTKGCQVNECTVIIMIGSSSMVVNDR